MVVVICESEEGGMGFIGRSVEEVGGLGFDLEKWSDYRGNLWFNPIGVVAPTGTSQ